jgi:hypothetical protein
MARYVLAGQGILAEIPAAALAKGDVDFPGSGQGVPVADLEGKR